MKVVITEPAEEDLVGIWLWIAENHPQNAERYIAKLRDRAATLAHLPRKGRCRDDLIPGCRVLAMDSILIIYRIVNDTVQILHFADGRRNLTRRIFKH